MVIDARGFRSLFRFVLGAGFFTLLTCTQAGLGPKVDITAPKVKITTPSTSGSYLAGTVHLAGTDSDDIAVKSLKVTYQTASGDASKNIPVVGKTWSVDLPSGTANGLAEGKNTITVAATDGSGKVTTDSVLVYVDNLAPSVLVTSPASYGTLSNHSDYPIYSDYVDIRGEAWDASPVSSVSVTLHYAPQSGGPAKTLTQTADGTNTWSVRFLLKTNGGLGSSDTGTALYYSIAVTDAAGNVNTYYYHTQDIYKVLPAGNLFPTTLDIGKLDQGVTTTSSSGITLANLQGIRIDNSAPHPWANLAFSYTSLPTVQYSNLDSSNPTANVLAPGSVIVGNVIPPANGAPIVSSDLVFKIYTKAGYPTTPIVSLPQSSLPTQLVLTNLGSSQSFRVELKDASGTSLPPAQYVFEVHTTPTSTDHIAFAIDTSAPTLTETILGNNLALLSAPFTMSGKADASAGLTSLKIEESADGGGTWTQASLVTYPASTTDDTWTSPSLPIAHNDGSYSYRITLLAGSGSAVVYRSVIYDATPPTLSVISPTPGTWSTASSLSLSGTSGDGAGTGVASVYYIVDVGTADHSSDVAAWNTTKGTSPPVSATSASWQATGGLASSWTGSASMASEGAERLWVVAADKGGNTDALTLKTAGTFTTGKTYFIETLGTTDFTTVGAASNTVGLSFTATGAGSGTGKAWTGTGMLIPFGRDASPPTLTVSAVPAVINAANAASLTALSGTAFDTNPTSFPIVTVQYTKNGVAQTSATAAYSPAASSYSSGNPWSWPFAVDASGHTTDGTYVFTITAADAAGKTASQTVNVSIDTTPPTDTVTQPGNYLPSNTLYWLSGSTASLSGTAADAGGTSFNQVAAVYFKIDTKGVSHASDNPTTWTLAAGTTNWSTTLDLTALGEGSFTLWTAAVDTAGNTSALLQRDFGVDQAPPTVTATGVASYAKAAFTASGSIGDSNALSTLVVSETKNGTPNGTVSATTTPASLTAQKTATFTTASLPKGGVVDGTYVYTFIATDVAGKNTSVTRTVVVDTVVPTVTLTALAAWNSSSALTIGGTAGDSGAGASGVASVQYQLDSGGWITANWIDGSGGANTTGNWNTTLTGLSEGSHTLAVRAADAAGNVCAPASGTFGVDLAPPTLTATAPSGTITAANAASFTSITGTLADSNTASVYGSTLTLALSSTQNGSAVATGAAVTPASSWTSPFTVDSAGHTTDGLWSFVFTATDVAGRTATVTKSVNIDTQAPVTTVTSPSSNGWVSGTSLSVTGVANDGTGTGVAAVWLKVDDLYAASTATDHSTETPSAGAGWTLASGQTNWSSAMTISGEGRKTLWVKAFDVAGNLTSTAAAVTSRIDFGLDLNPPTLSFSDSVGTQVKAGFTLSGTTTDTNPTGTPTLAVSVDGGAAQAITVTATNWTSAVSSLPADGSHTWVFTSTDVAGKTTTLSRTITVDTTAPTTTITNPGSYTASQSQYWLSGSTASISGTATDPGTLPSGVGHVYYVVDTKGVSHASDVPSSTWTLAAGTNNWSATLNLTAIGEGQFTVWVAAYDNAGNQSTLTQRDFGVDQAPPTLTETNHTATSSTKLAFTLAGAVGDTNALASLTVTESKNAGAPAAVTVTSTPASLAGVKTATWSSASLPLGGALDGSYAYVITSTDAAGKTTVVNRTVNVDTSPPTVSLTAIPSWVSSSAYTIGGAGTDPNAGASGVASVQYNLDSTGWVAATWIDTSGGANTAGNWSATLSALAEGNHSLVVRATDAAGNTASTTASSFGVDLTAPTLTETLLNTTAQVTENNVFTLTGSVTDTNPASVAGTSLTVGVSVNGGASQPATVTGTTWTFHQNKLDGTYSYAVTATDVSGKTTSVNRLVLLDSTPPTVTVTGPTTSSWSSAASLSPSGTAVDGSGAGIKNTYYLVDSAANDHTADIATWNATAGTAAPVSGTSAAWATASTILSLWSGSTTLSGEGSKILWVVSSDKAGNTTTLTKTTAGSFVVGTVYTIASVGNTDFTTVGAASNTVGLSFTATGAGAVSTGAAWSGAGAAVPFGYDVTPPTLTETAVNVATTVTENASVVFSGSAADTNALASAHSLTVSVDGGAAADVSFTTAPSWSYTYTVDAATHAQDGTHALVFTAADVAGKTTTVARSILVDTTPATATVSAPTAASWTNASSYTLAGTAADGSGSGISQVWVLVDASAVSHAADTPATITAATTWKQAGGTSNWTKAWALSGEGNKTLWVAVLDNAGNWSTTFSTVNFGYDVTAPGLTMSALGGFNAAFSITGTVADGASGVSTLLLKIDSGTFAPVTVAGSWTSAVNAATFSALAEGTHTVTVLSTDAAGNQSTQTASFNKDTLPPVVGYNNISAGGGSLVQDANPILTGSLTDASGVSVATYTLQVWNRGTSAWNAIATTASLGAPAGASNWAWSLDLSATGLNLPDGKYQIAIGATDTAGNSIATPAVAGFLVSRTSPATAVTTPSLGTYQNAAFAFVGTASDPNGVTQVKAKLASGAVDFTSGTTAALPALPVSVTTGAPGVFTTLAAHGFTNGTVVYVWGTPLPVTPTGSLVAGTAYYVTNAAANTFNLAATSGGAALAVNTSLGTNLVVAAASSTFSTFHPNLPVTVTTGNPATLTTALAHGLTAGDVVYLAATTLPAPATAAVAYYVVNPTATTFQLAATSGGSALALTTAGSAVTVFSPTQPVNWLAPSMAVTGFTDGPLTAYAQITSGSGKTSQTSRDFTLDTTGPTMSITSPVSTTRSVGNLTILGTSNDPGSLPSGLVGSIQYQIGRNYNLTNAASWISTNVTGGAYSWTIALGDMSGYANTTYAIESDTSGNPSSGTNLWKLPIVFQSTDKAGNVSQKTDYFLILDPNGNVPVVNITQPSTGLTFGGQQRITGTASQPVYIHDVEVAVDPTGGSNFPANAVAATVSGSTLSATAHPFTTGMMVYLSGATAPQIGGANVLPTTAYWVVSPAANTFQVSSTSGGSAVTFSSGGSGVTVSVWSPAILTTSGNSVIWYYDINSTTAYPQGAATSQTVSVQVRGWNAPTPGGARGTISGLLPTPLVMTFNSSFPKIQNVLINGQSYFSQITTKGVISLSAGISSSKGIGKIEAVESSPLSGSTTLYDTSSSYGNTNSSRGAYWSSTVTPAASKTTDTFANGNTTKVMITATGSNAGLWTAAGAPATTPGTVFTPNNVVLNVAGSSGAFIESDVSGNFNYTVTMSLDSTQLYSNTTGQYSFDFRATDLGSPAQVSTSNVTLSEDNYYSVSTLAKPATVQAGSFLVGQRYVIATLGTDFTAIGAPSNTVGLNFVATGAGTGTGTALEVITGTAFKVQGSATDVGVGSGSIGGLSKVIVYLRSPTTGNLLDIKTGGAATAAGTLTAKDMNNGGTIGSVPYPNTAAYNNTFASIDTTAEIGISDYNGDGLLESFTINGNNRDWWVQLNSTLLPDGPVEVHYVVWDQAGNATHYVVNSFVSNKAPTFGSMDIGTDVNGDGSVAAGETSNFAANANFAATNFVVRNNVLYFKINLSQGTNSPLYYSVKYGGTEQNGTLTNNTITISNFASIPDSTGANDRTFNFFVYDSTAGTTPGVNSQSFTQTVNLTIKNKDTTPPTLGFAPFGTVYTVNADDTQKTLATTTYASRIGASGGHAEYGSVNPYRYGTAIAATAMTGGSVYAIQTAGTTVFTSVGAAANVPGTIFIASGAGAGTGTVFPVTGTTTAASLVAGKAYTILFAGSTSFTAVGSADNNPGTTFIATGAGSGSGVAKDVNNAPALSGQVVMSGKAYDNQRLAMLTATIPGFDGGAGVGAEFTIAQWNNTGMSGITGTNWSLAIDSGSETVGVNTGDALNWSFTWDTSKLTTVAATNFNVTFKAYDFPSNGTATRASTTATSAALVGATIATGTPIYLNDPTTPTNNAWTTVSSFNSGTGVITLAATVNTAYTRFALATAPASAVSTAQSVDVVPYITDVQRPNFTAANKRSRYGKYPVSMVDYPSVTTTTVTVTGYNLKPDQTTGTDFTKIANAPMAALAKADTTISDNVTHSAGASPYTSFTLTLDANATHSGWLRFMVNGVEADNNLNSNFMASNKEDDGSGIASTKWNDDRYLSLWWTGDVMNGTSATQIQYPAMAQATNGNLFGSWVNYATGTLNYAGPSAAGNQASTQIVQFNDPEEFSDIWVNGTGTGTTNTTNNISVTYVANTIVGTAWATSASGYLGAWSNNGTMPAWNNQLTPPMAGPTAGATGWAFERLAYNSQLWQFQHPRIARSGTDLHVAYWDTKDNSLKYGHATTTTAGTTNVLGWVNIDGGSDAQDTGGAPVPTLAGATPAPPGIGLVTGYTAPLTRTTAAGTYLAIDLDPTNSNRPVIVYYDITNSTLRLAFATTTNPSTTAAWTVQPVFNSTDPNRNFVGRDVSIKFDASGNLYVVSYNIANGQLVYLTGILTAGKYVFGTSTIVDTGGAGTWSDVTLTGSTPYISYMNAAMIGTFNGVKMAYWDTTQATPDWENFTVPLTNATTDNRTNIEYNNVPTASTWQVAIGIKTNNFDVVYQRPLK